MALLSRVGREGGRKEGKEEERGGEEDEEDEGMYVDRIGLEYGSIPTSSWTIWLLRNFSVFFFLSVLLREVRRSR